MKTAVLLLSLNLAAALPQAPSAAPAALAPAQAACKVIPGDKEWPAPAVWKAALPRAVGRAAGGGHSQHPDYRLDAQTAEDVHAAVKFAAGHNIRLSILNSGHDFLGRNDAPSGLWLVVGDIDGVRLSKSFTATKEGVPRVNNKSKAEKLTVAPGEQAYVTFGAGLSTQRLNNALAPSGLFTMGAAHGEVSVAGGWGQAGGHSPFGIRYGLGVDQAVEYKVVTADGLKVANAVSNPDLFWALRGGGGGSFGVVVEATVKAYPSPKIGLAVFFLNTTKYDDDKSIYQPAVELHKMLPELTSKGISGYYYIYPNALKASILSADKEGSAAWLNKTLTPFFEKLASFPGISKETMTASYNDIPNYKRFFDAAFGSIDAKPPHRLSRRHVPGEMEMETLPMGIRPMDSVLLTQEDINNPNLADALRTAMPRTKNGQLRGNIASGLRIHELGNGTSVHPVWRKAYSHLIATGSGTADIDVASLRSLSKANAAYSNEASRTEPDWKNTFWGPNYPRLSQIQTLYDPSGVFWTSPGINADHFAVRDGRLCRVAAAMAAQFTRVSPTTDNKNFAKDVDGGADGRRFPFWWNGTAVVKSPPAAPKKGN